MSANKPTCPIHKPNPKRSEAKLKRGFGILAIKKSGMTEEQWRKSHDPLHGIKGKERHAQR